MKNSRVKKVVSVLVGLSLVASLSTGMAAKTTTASAKAAPTPLTLDIFDNAANYQGIRSAGWFDKFVKKKFNLTLNVLAPQVSGDSLYKTRAAAGNLGDIMIIDNNELKDCIKAGLVMDLTKMINNYPNLKKYSNHFKYFNANFDKTLNPKGLIYAMPTNEQDTSPVTFSQSIPYSSPMMPWTYYTGIGAPKIKNLDDLLTQLKKMQAKFPKTAEGKTVVPITLWKDWDNYIMENARWLCNWYGFEEPSETSTVLLNAKGTVQQVTDDKGIYLQILKFYNKAYKMGLVDPDSASQDWNKVADKLTANQVLLMWYNWQTGFFNTIARGQKKEGVVSVPIADTHIIQDGDSYYGDGRVFAVGSKTKDPKRVMQFLDWYSSQEGMRLMAAGIEGFTYTVQANGKLKYTDKGQSAFTNNLPVPAAWGGGGYKDGQCTINTYLMGDYTKDPGSKETYNPNYWSSTIEANKTALTKDWTKKFGAEDAISYYKKHKMIDIVPSINASVGTDTSDIKNKRSQCKQAVVDTSWKMVFAKNDSEFNSLWKNMKTELVGYGWNDLVKEDTKRCKDLVQLRAKAKAGK